MFLAKYGSGDDGKSASLGSSERVWKDEDIFQAIGDIDELNSFIGLTRSFCDKNHLLVIQKTLEAIQRHLFKIGSELSAIQGSYSENIPRITEEDVDFLEEKIHELEEKLPPLKSFIIPSGTKLASLLHVCRTVCRRAERSLVKLHRKKSLPPELLKYINRLSSLFFILARYANVVEGEREEIWESREVD